MTVHFFGSFFFFSFFFYSFDSPYSSHRRWIFFPWAICRRLVGWQSERGDKGEEHMMWSKLIWDEKVAWKQREWTTKFFCSSVFFQLSFFFSLPWEQIWCLSDTAVHIPKYSRMQLVLHQHHSCSPSPSWEQCSVAVGTAVKCSNGVRAFLQRYSKAGVSVWTFTVAVEGVKPTYSLNTFIGFHWGSCLFILDKEANLFSSSVFMCISFTMKLYLF